MSWTDFDEACGLERDMLLRALPLVPTEGSDGWRMRIDQRASDPVRVEVASRELVGATPGKCVALLGIRPLLFSVAWKVLDLLLEEAFLQIGKVPDLSRGFSIGEKGRLARSGVGCPAALGSDVWKAITLTYDSTRVLRDSLVHRRVFVDPTDSLIGLDAGGGKLPPLGAPEQEALAHVALRASDVVIGQSADTRVDVDLRNQLTILLRLHKVSLASGGLPPQIPEITVVLDPGSASAGVYPLDVPTVLACMPFAGSAYADLIVEFRDRPGQVLRGRLENAPRQMVALDPDQPPNWLT